MSLATTATIVSLLSLNILNDPIDINLGYDQIHFSYDSFDYSYQSPIFYLFEKGETITIDKHFDCNNKGYLTMYKPTD